MKYLLLLLISSLTGTVQAQNFLPILTEGKSWTCGEMGTIYDEEPEQVYTLFVSGDTIVNGKKCVRIGKKYESGTETFYSAVYEEGGRLCCFESDEDGTGSMHEVEMCNMNLGVGDPAWNGVVTRVDTIQVRGVIRRRIIIDDWKLYIWVEGIGAYCDGWPSTLLRHNAYDCILACYENGQLVFTQDDFYAAPVTSGISTTETIAGKVYATYDLQGRRVERTLKNGIYIRHGKKFVQR